MNSAGRTEVSVLGRQSIQFTITSLVGDYSTIDQSVQISPSIVLPADRWSSAGTAIVEGDVFLRDQPGVPSPVCNLKLVRGPLDFIILAPKGNNPSSWQSTSPVGSKCCIKSLRCPSQERVNIV